MPTRCTALAGKDEDNARRGQRFRRGRGPAGAQGRNRGGVIPGDDRIAQRQPGAALGQGEGDIGQDTCVRMVSR